MALDPNRSRLVAYLGVGRGEAIKAKQSPADLRGLDPA